MKIVVAGAGIGGLYTAGLLANEGHDVTVYEKVDSPEKMRYDWVDDIEPSAFTNAGLPLAEGSYPKKDWTFYPPLPKGNMHVNMKKEWLEYSVDRKKLNEILLKHAQKAKIVFGVSIENVIIRDNKVVGVLLANDKKEEVYCDLVIDSSGVNSPLRASLPQEWGFPSIDKESVFFVERSFYKMTDKIPEDSNRVYMKHMGEKGISWCITDQGEGDILIGHVGELTEEHRLNALHDICSTNPVDENTCIRKGDYCTIPVRRPLSRFVWDGYACIGDSACMTVPMIGSGIGTSLMAGSFLAETLLKENATDAKTLWQYQRKCVRAFSGFYGIEYLKNWLLERNNEEVTWFFTSGIINNDDLSRVSTGRMVKLAFPDIFRKAYVGMKSPKLLFQTVGMLMKANYAIWVSKMIPKEYKIEKIKKWQRKVDGLFA